MTKENKDETEIPIFEESEEKAGHNLVLPDQILPPNLFVLPLSQPVVFPTIMAPLSIHVPKFISTVESVLSRQRFVGLLLTKSSQVSDETKYEDLYDVGVIVKVLKRLKMPDGTTSLLVHALKRFRAKKLLADHPHIVVEAEYLEDVYDKSDELDALNRLVVAQVKKLSESNPFFTEELRLAMINAPGPSTVADLVSFALGLQKKDSQDILETLEIKSRLEKILLFLRKEQDLADISKKISDEVNTKITKLQREFFLREQMKSIKKELGSDEEGRAKGVRTYREKIEALGLSEDVKKIALEEVEKFETLSEHSPEYNVLRTYLDLFCALPWSKETPDILDVGRARQILEADHFGLEKVKERVIEFLAVRALKKNTKGSIICLVGPPGVGKTSIGKSIAKSLGREFYRFSLGGIRDEAEIRGHRRTYIGALPGKFIQAMKRAGTRNPVLMLDEIDKIGTSYQGDPASALLEVLDPEQNHTFLDHYLDVPFDLSKTLFVATANSTATIPGPLLDRMEVVELPGYTLEEKEEILKRFVIPKEIEDSGLKMRNLRFESGSIKSILKDYAREPGLRGAQQQVNRICRKVATKIVENKDAPEKTSIVRQNELKSWLGPKKYHSDVLERITNPGIVVGLAWTPLGGDTLFIEATEMPGSGQLKLTGQMGEVMTESAAIAWSVVKKKLAFELGFLGDDFKARDVHVHIPSGAVPKDGPSAGVTMATALYSLFMKSVARPKVAMTGEISLSGKVLAVGGIKEKVLAAKRAGVNTIILPKFSEKDLEDLPHYALDGMTFHFVSSFDEVLKIAIGKEKKSNSKRVPLKPQSKFKISKVSRSHSRTASNNF